MITKHTEFNIICSQCGIDGCCNVADDWQASDQSYEWNYTMPVSEKGIRDMRKIAKEHGWTYSKGKDLCPRCVEAVVLGEK